MHTNWQVCSLVVQAKSERISDISTQMPFPAVKLLSATRRAVS